MTQTLLLMEMLQQLQQLYTLVTPYIEYIIVASTLLGVGVGVLYHTSFVGIDYYGVQDIPRI